MNVEYFSFCPALLKLIKEGAATGVSGKRYNSLSALSTLRNIHILRELILDLKPKNTLEIGLAFGGSALAILASLEEIWRSVDYSHSAIDPFQKTVWDNVAVNLIEKGGFEKKFTCINDFSCYVLPGLIKQQRKYGLVYIDGSHLFEDVFLDMYFVCDLLLENGVVIFDDCMDVNVAKVIRFINSNYNEILAEVDLGKYVSRQTFMKRIANHLGFRQARGFMKKGNARREWNSRFTNF